MAIKRTRFHNVVIYDGKCECFLWKLVNVGGYQVKGKSCENRYCRKVETKRFGKEKKTGEESRVLRIAKRINFGTLQFFLLS
jgi:hypothetical protein